MRYGGCMIIIGGVYVGGCIFSKRGCTCIMALNLLYLRYAGGLKD
jgi:hypothetical protein